MHKQGVSVLLLLCQRAKNLQRAGEQQQGFKKEGETLHMRPGWERWDKTCAAGQHRPPSHCEASGDETLHIPMPDSSQQPGVLPC